MQTPDGDARFRLMFERSADAILLLDTRTKNFVEYNQDALDMLRCTREELSTLHPAELSPPTQPDGMGSFEAANLRIATAVREGSHRFEWEHQSPHRPPFPVEVSLTLVQGGEFPLLLVVWRDITDRRRSEEALRASQKREALGVLTGGVAHDFNNLLTAIGARLSLARAKLETGHPALTHLTHADQAVEDAAGLCRQLLAYGGHRQLGVEAVDLGQGAEQTVALLRPAMRRGVQLALEHSGEPAVVVANRSELLQVVMNLVQNAAEASDPGGVVSVRIATRTLAPGNLTEGSWAQGLAPGPWVLLEVSDTGHGMTPEVQQRIFDPFFSTKGAGRGLGLSALQGIVRHLGGSLSVRTAPGQGSHFIVALPRSRSKPVAQKARAVHGAPRGVGRVLVVDDQAAIRSSLAHLLQAMGFETVEAEDGAAAVEAYKAAPGRFAFVVMDLTMPGMDGHAAFLAIRAHDAAAKVVLSSGWAQEDLTERFRAAPPLGFLPKPYQRTELENVLRRLGLLSEVP